MRSYLTLPYPSFLELVHPDGSHSLQLYFSWHNCPLPFYPFISKFFLMLRSLKSSVITFVSFHWRWPKYLSLCHQISSGTLIILSFLWSSWVLICYSRLPPQTLRTILLSAYVKRCIVFLELAMFCSHTARSF